ncbi:hypothetical protein C8F04DRAFT_1400465, partial [Mycena alexandri]
RSHGAAATTVVPAAPPGPPFTTWHACFRTTPAVSAAAVPTRCYPPLAAGSLYPRSPRLRPIPPQPHPNFDRAQLNLTERTLASDDQSHEELGFASTPPPTAPAVRLRSRHTPVLRSPHPRTGGARPVYPPRTNA